MSNYKTETFDLSQDTSLAPDSREISHATVSVLKMPAAPQGILIGFDDDELIPLEFPQRFDYCPRDGKFLKVRIANPPQAGELVLLCTNGPLPLLSGSAGSDPVLARFLDVRWTPHIPQTSGGPISTTGQARGGLDVPGFIAGTIVQAPGAAPVQGIRNGRPCAITQPGAGGGSGLALYHCIPWVRTRTGLGVVLNDHPDAAHQGYHLEVEVAADAAGGTDGIGAGIYLTPTGGVIAGEGFPDNGISPNAFLGVVRNGAGGWRVCARAASGGALTLIDDITAVWPSPITVPVRVHLALFDADPVSGRDGLVVVSLNEVPIRTYTNMAVFPDAFANGSPTFTTYRARVMGKGAAATELSFANINRWDAKLSGVAQ